MPAPPFSHVTFEAIGREELNRCLIAWGHKMGPVRRPSRGWSHGLVHEGRTLAVVATDTLIRPRVAGMGRHEAIELSRLCAARPDLCRVALRLWRSFVFPALCRQRGCRWAISYQDANAHTGDLYRFDGWVRLAVSRSGTDPRTGRKGRRKVVWGWCESTGERGRRRLATPSGVQVRSPSPRDGLAPGDSNPQCLFDLTILAGRSS